MWGCGCLMPEATTGMYVYSQAEWLCTHFFILTLKRSTLRWGTLGSFVSPSSHSLCIPTARAPISGRWSLTSANSGPNTRPFGQRDAQPRPLDCPRTALTSSGRRLCCTTEYRETLQRLPPYDWLGAKSAGVAKIRRRKKERRAAHHPCKVMLTEWAKCLPNDPCVGG